MDSGARCLRSMPAVLLSGLATTLRIGGCPVRYQGQLLDNGEPAGGKDDFGQFVQTIPARETQNNRFWVRTGKPRVKVSWQVTGVRRDAYAFQNPLQVEPAKSDADRIRDQHGQADRRSGERSQRRDERAEGR